MVFDGFCVFFIRHQKHMVFTTGLGESLESIEVSPYLFGLRGIVVFGVGRLPTSGGKTVL